MTERAMDGPAEFITRRDAHEIDPVLDMALGFTDADDGSRISLTELQVDDAGQVFAQAVVEHVDSDLPLGGKVRLSSQVLKASERITLEFMQEHKTGLQIVAASAIVIAAGRGISVYRTRQRDM